MFKIVLFVNLSLMFHNLRPNQLWVCHCSILEGLKGEKTNFPLKKTLLASFTKQKHSCKMDAGERSTTFCHIAPFCLKEINKAIKHEFLSQMSNTTTYLTN